MAPLHHPIISDMAAHLRQAPHLDLNKVQEPWMYLRGRGYSHKQLEQHLEAAIREAQKNPAENEAA